MSTLFPTSIDSPTNPTGTDKVSLVDHAAQHANANDAYVALETKVGVNGSAVTTTHDYKLSGVIGSDKAVSKTGNETLTNKTLTTPTIGDFTNSTHTHLNAAGGGSLGAAAIGSGTIATARLGSGSATSGTFLRGDQTWSSVSTTVYPAFFSVVRLAGSLTPSLYMDSESYMAGGVTTFLIESLGNKAQSRTITSDYATADAIVSAVLLGSFVYLMLRDDGAGYKVYRYDKTNLAAGGTQMTFSGQSLTFQGNSQIMACDGTSFYFNYKSGGSANDYVISKFSISGTTFTYISDITCGASGNVVDRTFVVDSSQNIYGIGTGSSAVRKYNSSGTIQYTGIAFSTVSSLCNYVDNFYTGHISTPSSGVSGAWYEKAIL